MSKFMSTEPLWYVLHTFSGYEAVAKQNLEQVIENGNLHDRIFEIVIPTEDVIEENDGKRRIVTRKSMPCYIFIKMIYGDDIWHTITHTRGITGFVGPKGRPLPLTEDEIRKMHLEKVVVDFTLEVGDRVRIMSGALVNTECKVTKVDNEAQRCEVVVDMFGRETPLELDYSQVSKI
ncbi:MAG: transcription termination/antitermination factor NusG [Clostridia bacterium]|nr:transcription termination/antitermination factor NusG [Clostridia bacterium]